MKNKDIKNSNLSHTVYDKDSGKIVYIGDVADSYQRPLIRQQVKEQKEIKRANKNITVQYGEKISMFQEVMIQSTKMKYEELRMFNFFLGICDFENWISINQKDVAEWFGTKQPNICRSIKSLIKRKYILSIKKDGRNCYRLNPQIGWKGTFANHKKELAKETD